MEEKLIWKVYFKKTIEKVKKLIYTKISHIHFAGSNIVI